MYQPFDDSELDRLSRDASDKYTVPGKPDWEALREELDIVMPVKERKRRFLLFWWLVPVILASGGWLYWLSIHTGSMNEKSINVIKQVPVLTSPSLVKTKPEVKNSEAVITRQPLDATTIQKKSIQNEVVQVNQMLQKKSTKTTPLFSSNPVTPLQEANKNQHQQSRFENTDHTGSIHSASAENTSVTNVNNPTLPSIQANFNPSQDSIKQIIPISTETTPTKKSETTISDSMDTKTVAKAVTVVKHTSGKGFSYSISAGVDKSTVKYTHDDHPGYNLGIEIGYHFNQHWSIQTGAIYTQKKYTVTGTDFTPPKGSWASYYHFDQIDGYCRMWEIPLLVRYQPGTERKPSRFAFSTGLSSYFMTRENYTYYYQYNGQALSRTNNYPSSDTHLLSVWHLSAEYSSPLSKIWSLGIEPYAKLPLGGVGFGQIRLSSFGINLILRHKQPDKK